MSAQLRTPPCQSPRFDIGSAISRSTRIPIDIDIDDDENGDGAGG